MLVFLCCHHGLVFEATSKAHACETLMSAEVAFARCSAVEKVASMVLLQNHCGFSPHGLCGPHDKVQSSLLHAVCEGEAN